MGAAAATATVANRKRSPVEREISPLTLADGRQVHTDDGPRPGTTVEKLAALKIPVVVGTTGWLGERERVQAAIERNKTGLVWSPNFSIGVNVFFRLLQEAARLMADEPSYGAWAWEIHHDTKKDAPSGTLLKLINEMEKAGYAGAISVSSNRAGGHPGTHEIGFDSAGDTITLRHTARSREGFARGALKAAQWLVGQKGFHEFNEILFS